MPYRIPAPPDAEAHDTEDPYAAVLRSQRTRARIVSVVVVFLAGGIAKVARSRETPRWHVAEASIVSGHPAFPLLTVDQAASEKHCPVKRSRTC